MSLATSNIFSALDTKKKKKSSGKHSHDAADKKKVSSKAQSQPPSELHQRLFTGPSKPAVTNWADTDEEDDFEDDIGPLPQSWLQSGAVNGSHTQKETEEPASDSEEEARVEEIHEALGLEVTKQDDDDDDEDEEAAAEALQTAAPTSTPAPALQLPPPEKQISKKEQKRLELEEMNKVLAELGIEQPSTQQRSEPAEDVGEADKAGGEEATPSGTDTAAAKKKKKKDRRKPEGAEAAPEPSEGQQSDAEEPSVVNPAEAKKLLAKKLASQSKKSAASSASVAAREAKERAAKKGKMKDKKNYNQAPTR